MKTLTAADTIPDPSSSGIESLAQEDDVAQVAPSDADTHGDDPVSASPTNDADAAADLPLEERIRNAAYRRYQQRDGADGDPTRDWLDAEAEVRRGS